jgi:Tol biopolymer transport system component
MLIATVPTSDTRIGWSPDWKHVAFLAPIDGSPYRYFGDLHVMNADGSDDVELGTNVTWQNFAWSPDGTQMAWVSTYTLAMPPKQGDLFIADADGTNMSAVASNVESEINLGVFQWSPDSEQIAFVRGRPFHIYLVSLAGEEPQSLTTSCCDQNPTWHPDGAQIIFESGRDGCCGYLYSATLDGHTETRLTDGNMDISYFQSFAQPFSPDGTLFAFRDVVCDTGNCQADLFVMNSDGSNMVRLTDGPEDDSFPIWSPDGSWLAFSRRGESIVAIYIVRQDGSSLTELARFETDGSASLLAWQP